MDKSRDSAPAHGPSHCGKKMEDEGHSPGHAQSQLDTNHGGQASGGPNNGGGSSPSSIGNKMAWNDDLQEMDTITVTSFNDHLRRLSSPGRPQSDLLGVEDFLGHSGSSKNKAVSPSEDDILQKINVSGILGDEDAESGDITIDMLIPTDKVGLVIGKGGKNIKALQEKSGAKMNVIQHSNTYDEFDKTLRMVGPADLVQHARQLVYELITRSSSETTSSSPGNYPSTNKVHPGHHEVPSHPRHRPSPGHSIANSPGNNPSTGGGGSSSNTTTAGSTTQQIRLKVIRYPVPKIAVGLIIGRGGDTIKKIRTETGAKVQFDPVNNNLEDLDEQAATLTGKPEQIRHACEMIQDLVRTALKGVQQQHSNNIPNNPNKSHSNNSNYISNNNPRHRPERSYGTFEYGRSENHQNNKSHHYNNGNNYNNNGYSNYRHNNCNNHHSNNHEGKNYGGNNTSDGPKNNGNNKHHSYTEKRISVAASKAALMLENGNDVLREIGNQTGAYCYVERLSSGDRRGNAGSSNTCHSSTEDRVFVFKGGLRQVDAAAEVFMSKLRSYVKHSKHYRVTSGGGEKERECHCSAATNQEWGQGDPSATWSIYHSQNVVNGNSSSPNEAPPTTSVPGPKNDVLKTGDNSSPTYFQWLEYFQPERQQAQADAWEQKVKAEQCHSHNNITDAEIYEQAPPPKSEIPSLLDPAPEAPPETPTTLQEACTRQESGAEECLFGRMMKPDLEAMCVQESPEKIHLLEFVDNPEDQPENQPITEQWSDELNSEQPMEVPLEVEDIPGNPVNGYTPIYHECHLEGLEMGGGGGALPEGFETCPGNIHMAAPLSGHAPPAASPGAGLPPGGPITLGPMPPSSEFNPYSNPPIFPTIPPGYPPQFGPSTRVVTLYYDMSHHSVVVLNQWHYV